jgi:hypothetical protein
MAEATQKQVKKVFISLTEEEAEVLKRICFYSHTIPERMQLSMNFPTPSVASNLMAEIYVALSDLRD